MSNTTEHISNGETATAITESGSKVSSAANSRTSSLTMTTAEETDTSDSDEPSEDENEFFNFHISPPPMPSNNIRRGWVSIPMPSNPIDPTDLSEERKWPEETIREFQISTGSRQPEPDKENMPQEELIAALREAFKEYKSWPLNALKIRLRQNEAYLKETLKIIAFAPNPDNDERYQLKSEEA